VASYRPHDRRGIVALAYPFGDIVIIFLIVLSVRSMTATGRRPLLWVLVGLFAMAVSDSTYAYLVEVGRYATGNLVDIGWAVGYLAIAVGASADAGHAVRAPSELSTEASLASLVTPYVPVLLALSVITFEMEIHHHVDRFSWLTGFGLALLVIARQALLLSTIAMSCSRFQTGLTSRARRRALARRYRTRASWKLLRGPSLSGEARELQPRHFGNTEAPSGDTEAAIPNDRARPHGRHQQHRGIRPLFVRVLRFPLIGGNVGQVGGSYRTKRYLREQEDQLWRSWKRNPRSTDFSEDIRRPCLGPRTGPISWLEMAVCCEGSTRQSSCAEVI